MMSNRLLVGYSQLESASNCDAKLSFTLFNFKAIKLPYNCIGITAYNSAPLSIEEMNVAQYAVK
jgi:hypothetical protein